MTVAPLDYLQPFIRDTLAALGAPFTRENDAALIAWANKEGTSALNNPLATTQREPGSWNFNNLGGGTGVQNYPSEPTGVTATMETLTNGFYPHIVADLRSGHGELVAGEASGELATWGTHAIDYNSALAEAAGTPATGPAPSQSAAPPASSSAGSGAGPVSTPVSLSPGDLFGFAQDCASDIVGCVTAPAQSATGGITDAIGTLAGGIVKSFYRLGAFSVLLIGGMALVIVGGYRLVANTTTVQDVKSDAGTAAKIGAIA